MNSEIKIQNPSDEFLPIVIKVLYPDKIILVIEGDPEISYFVKQKLASIFGMSNEEYLEMERCHNSNNYLFFEFPNLYLANQYFTELDYICSLEHNFCSIYNNGKLDKV